MNILLYSSEKNKQYILVPICNNYVFYKDGFYSHYHIHPVYHLVFVLNGQGYLISDNTKYRLNEKDIFVVNPNEKHIYTSDHPCGMNHFTVNFFLLEANTDRLSKNSFIWESAICTDKIQSLADTSKLDSLFSFKSKEVFVQFDKSRWADLLLLIEAFCKSVDEIRKSPYYIISGKQPDLKHFSDRYSRFLTEFLDLISDTDADNQYIEISRKDVLLNSIINQLSYKVYDGFHLSALAEELNYSPEYLCSYFKRRTGITITQYLNKLKIAKACEFLKRSDKTITEIASIFNFSSSNHFSNSFKKEKGLSPKDFRKHSEL